MWVSINWIIGLVSLVCFILVLIKMFQNGQTTLGIVCAVLALCGIGFLIAFIYGWMNARNWGLQNVMIVWTVCIIVNLLLPITGLAPFPQFNLPR